MTSKCSKFEPLDQRHQMAKDNLDASLIPIPTSCPCRSVGPNKKINNVSVLPLQMSKLGQREMSNLSKVASVTPVCFHVGIRRVVKGRVSLCPVKTTIRQHP